MTIEIELTERFRRFIEERVAAGEYRDAGEVVQAALRLLEEARQLHELKVERLRAALMQGVEQLDRGEGAEIPLEDIDRYFDERERNALALQRAHAAAE